MKALATQVVTRSVDVVDRSRGWGRRLERARSDDSYRLPYATPEPRVTVIIPTHTSPDELWSRAIPSALSQDYPNVNVVIAIRESNKDAIARTRREIASLETVEVVVVKEPRYTYKGEHRRWLSSGTDEFNAALSTAPGLWFAPLAHDDELTHDAVSSLLERALGDQLEFVYGDTLRAIGERAGELLCSDPPRESQIALQGSLWHRSLRMFRLQKYDAMAARPNDWGAVRRMMGAGVRVGHLHQVTCRYFPSRWT